MVLVDDLVAEWETTSVDFKREVSGGTASEKAELFKLSIETSRDWRRLGIARALLEFCV